jgi:dihydrofolate synthase/folylpolyglutamate synthase
MTYEQALAYLDTFVNYEHTPQPAAMRQMTLDRMRRLCQRLGDPQRSFRSVLVAGTNGKGSICAMLYSMLREASLRVGLYTSPHLEDLRERIRVWGADRAVGERAHADDWIDPMAFAALVERLQPLLEEMRRLGPDGVPTSFEILTALAFLYFSQRRVDVAVLEVGLGGRLDATNVVQQAVSVIGPIAVDHVELLGADPALIAREKGGIIKPRQTVLTALQSGVAEEVLRVLCEGAGVPLLTCGRDLTASVHRQDLRGLEVTVTGLRGLYESLKIPLIGRHQAQNAALAIGALEALSPTGIPHTVVERGLARVEWPGRTEVVHDEPLVVMDGAHNPHAAGALRETLVELCGNRRIHLLIGMSSDKSVEGLGESVGRIAVSATCTKSRHPRALDPTKLAKRLAPFCPDVHVMSEAADAYTYLLNAVAPSDAIVVTGSLYLVGELRSALRTAVSRMSRTVGVTS